MNRTLAASIVVLIMLILPGTTATPLDAAPPVLDAVLNPGFPADIAGPVASQSASSCPAIPAPTGLYSQRTPNPALFYQFDQPLGVYWTHIPWNPAIENACN